MGEEIACENNRISDFQGLVTLTLDWVILHTVMHHSSTSTYKPNFIEIEETFCGWTDGRMEGHLRPALLGRLKGVDLKMWKFHQNSQATINSIVQELQDVFFCQGVKHRVNVKTYLAT